MTNDTTKRIAELNDLCRTAMGVAGRLVQTCGISALPPADRSAIREKVETFDAFTADNDPHGERDFVAFEHNSERIFWKIDYYDRTRLGILTAVTRRASQARLSGAATATMKPLRRVPELQH